jgi:hypothetical protein
VVFVFLLVAINDVVGLDVGSLLFKVIQSSF